MSLKNASVLIIDDDVDVLTAVRLLLRPEVKEIVTERIRKIFVPFFPNNLLM
jgi:hypothetical protein